MKTKSTNSSITLGEFAHQIIDLNCQKIVSQETAVLVDQDPEPLHQMRVGMRRLRTALAVFDTAIVSPKGMTRQSIGKVAKTLGETRDLDVLEEALVKRYKPLLQKPERTTFKDVLKHLHHQRDRSFHRLEKTLHGDRYSHFKRACQSWLEQPTYTLMGHLPMLPMVPDLLLPLVSQLFLHPGWLVGTTIQANVATPIPLDNQTELTRQLQDLGEVLHDLRKQIKAVRYQAEFFSGFYTDIFHQRTEELKTMQDVLGSLQDNVVMHQFFATALTSPLSVALPSVAYHLQQEQADFWQTWQPFQSQYLSASFRQEWRSLLSTPLEDANCPSP